MERLERKTEDSHLRNYEGAARPLSESDEAIGTKPPLFSYPRSSRRARRVFEGFMRLFASQPELGQAEPGAPDIPVPPDPTIPQPSDPAPPPLPGPDIPPLPEEEPGTRPPIEEPPIDPGAPDDPSQHPLIAAPLPLMPPMF